MNRIVYFIGFLATCADVFHASAQEAGQQRMLQAESYFHFYVYPKEICAAAGPESLARLESVLTGIRTEQQKAFAVVEQSKEYQAVVAAMRAVPSPPRDAQRECARLTDGMPHLYQYQQKNEVFKYWISLFLQPI